MLAGFGQGVAILPAPRSGRLYAELKDDVTVFDLGVQERLE